MSFHISHVRVVVDGAAPAVARGLRCIFAACARPLLPCTREEHLRVAEDGSGFQILLGSRSCARTDSAEDVLPLLEQTLYAALPDWHPDCALLHGATLHDPDSGLVWLLTGDSGAGKSSLALEGLRRGLRYFGDELAITDGARIWGLPRAIQFSAMDVQAVPIERLRGADRESYPLRLRDGIAGVVPMVPVAPEQVPPGPLEVEALRVVWLRRGGDSLRSATPFQVLQALHRGPYAGPRISLSGCLGSGRGFALEWDDPARAWERLLAWRDADSPAHRVR